ncbi:hypothetical protein JGU66_23030 [Myxococcaceae bacterium JPH2]|nr:hypothetical protein [Myxococcaceae bacterium JPH2]
MSRMLGLGLLLLSVGCGGGHGVKPGGTQAGTSVLIGNVGGDGGGFVILPNGTLGRIPPWTGPLAVRWLDLLSNAVLLDRLENSKDSEEQALRPRVEQRMADLATEVRRQMVPQANFATEALQREMVVIVYLSPGVSRDGGGFAITANGRLIRIPPRGPDALRIVLQVAQRLQLATEPRGKPQPDPWRPIFEQLEVGLADAMKELPAALERLN